MIYPTFRAAAELSHVAGWPLPGALCRALSVEPSPCGC